MDKGIKELQNNSQQIAGVVIGSLGAIGSAIVTLVLALVLCFFFLKDGPRFLPWLRDWIGVDHRAAHSRWWPTGSGPRSGQYVWSQAAVALVDGLFIGIGVWLLGVPFALPIAVLTFFGGFVPIVGAFVAGAIATLVALVSNGVWTAVAVLAIVLVVQQLEGNVMQPILVGRTLKIHAGGGAGLGRPGRHPVRHRRRVPRGSRGRGVPGDRPVCARADRRAGVGGATPLDGQRPPGKTSADRLPRSDHNDDR